jgi:hypothetical protein
LVSIFSFLIITDNRFHFTLKLISLIPNFNYIKNNKREQKLFSLNVKFINFNVIIMFIIIIIITKKNYLLL